MRGKIDLSGHKLAGLYRAPPKRTRRQRQTKRPDDTYAQIARLVDGAVRDAFACHPDYLTAHGKESAAGSINKRVTGALHGYATATAAAWGRSGGKVGPSGPAAERSEPSPIGAAPRTWLALATSWVRWAWRTRGGVSCKDAAQNSPRGAL